MYYLSSPALSTLPPLFIIINLLLGHFSSSPCCWLFLQTQGIGLTIAGCCIFQGRLTEIIHWKHDGKDSQELFYLLLFRKCRRTKNVWRNPERFVVSCDQVARHNLALASGSQPKERSSGCCHCQQLALPSPYICHGVEGAILIQIINKMFIFLHYSANSNVSA